MRVVAYVRPITDRLAGQGLCKQAILLGYWHGVSSARVKPKPLGLGSLPHLYRISANGPRAPIIDRVLNASGLGLPRKHLPRHEGPDARQ